MVGRLKTKTGRRAEPGAIDRTTARVWVDLYRQAMEAPGGRVCLNPEDEPETQTWIDSADPAPLLSLLKNYAEEGTFEHVGKTYDAIRLLPMRHAYREMRKAGQTHQFAVEELAEEYGLSTRQIERKVSTDKS